MVMTSLAATRYCLPPVLITANIVLPRVRAGLSARARGAGFLAVSASGRGFLRPQTQARGRGPAREGQEISRERPPVNVAMMLRANPDDVADHRPRRSSRCRMRAGAPA